MANDITNGIYGTKRTKLFDEEQEKPQNLNTTTNYKVTEVAYPFMNPTSFNPSGNAFHFSTPVEKKYSRMANASPSSSYERAAKEIGNTQFSPTGTLYKQCTIQGITYNVATELLGKGDSFQSYKSDNLVLKLFVSLFDKSKIKKQPSTADFDTRMDLVKTNYEKAIELNIPSAKIINSTSLKTDGCILQELTTPFKPNWASNPLNDEAREHLYDFCSILTKAMANPNYAWDLKPDNFGIDSSGRIALFDFSDRPLPSSQWDYFHQAIVRWISGNVEAKSILIQALDNMLYSNDHVKHYEDILYCKNRLEG